MPKCERYGLGHKIDSLFIELLDTLQKATFSPINSKIPLLSKSIIQIDSIKFFIQFCWELKLLSAKHFSTIGRDVEIIGKMTGGWYKGLITKTSAETKEKK